MLLHLVGEELLHVGVGREAPVLADGDKPVLQIQTRLVFIPGVFDWQPLMENKKVSYKGSSNKACVTRTLYLGMPALLYI